MSKFLGSYEILQDKVKQLEIIGEWNDRPNGQKQFKARNGAILNWWEKTGTLTYQGDERAKNDLESRLTPILETDSNSTFFNKDSSPNNKKVFVVYGHDEMARTQLDAMLRRWKLEPLILDQLPSKGQTIIEKLEDYTSSVDFAVVLATPDDEGHRKGHEDEKICRARQNVVLELGMLLMKLGRSRVAILMKDQEKMERPSDIQGLIYIPFKSDLQKDAGPLLAREMAEQGFAIDVKDL